jgi:hypothetical protein
MPIEDSSCEGIHRKRRQDTDDGHYESLASVNDQYHRR